MNWKKVRSLTLTCDPRLWDAETGENSGLYAYMHIMEKKYIPQLIHNLNRTKGAQIIDWMWILEWHRNGFPHWHLYCEVEEQGRAGMIGADNIRHYWTAGAIKEQFIENEGHWRAITGYFSKHGYFQKNKAHQAVLPAWARYDLLRKIRKYGSKRIAKCELLTRSQIENQIEQEERKLRKQSARLRMSHGEKQSEDEMEMLSREPYCVILDRCGETAQALIECSDGLVFGTSINFPYTEVVGWCLRAGVGEFVPKAGFIARMNEEQMAMFEKEFLKTSNEEALGQLNTINDCVNF